MKAGSSPRVSELPLLRKKSCNNWPALIVNQHDINSPPDELG